MKFKLNAKNATSTSVGVASTGLGVMVSKGTNSLLPVSNRTAIRVGIVALAALGAASIESKGHVETAAQGLLAGIAVEQTVQVVSNLIAPTLPESETPGKFEKFGRNMLGLNGGNDFSYDLDSNMWENPINGFSNAVEVTTNSMES